MGTQTPRPSGELGKRMVHSLNWERSAAPGEFSLQQHRDQGQSLDFNCWDSSVSEPFYTCLSQPGVWLVGRGSPAPASQLHQVTAGFAGGAGAAGWHRDCMGGHLGLVTHSGSLFCCILLLKNLGFGTDVEVLNEL